MSAKVLQYKQRLMELGSNELRRVLTRFYASKGSAVSITTAQKAYKL